MLLLQLQISSKQIILGMIKLKIYMASVTNQTVHTYRPTFTCWTRVNSIKAQSQAMASLPKPISEQCLLFIFAGLHWKAVLNSKRSWTGENGKGSKSSWHSSAMEMLNPKTNNRYFQIGLRRRRWPNKWGSWCTWPDDSNKTNKQSQTLLVRCQW